MRVLVLACWSVIACVGLYRGFVANNTVLMVIGGVLLFLNLWAWYEVLTGRK